MLVVAYREYGKIRNKSFSSPFWCRKFLNKLFNNEGKYELISYPSWVLVGGK